MESAETQPFRYTPQFWLMFAGLVISSTGTTMIWPFIMIYASSRLSLPMAAVASLMTLNSLAGLTSALLAGSLLDRFGRKSIMAVGLFGAALVYLGYMPVAEYWQFAILMIGSGFFQPLYHVGSDAILADMVPAEHRTNAYSIFRMGRNIGVALGPILGGIALATSYSIGILAAAIALSIFGFITVIFLHETLQRNPETPHENLREQLAVYRQALRHPLFSRLVLGFTLTQICVSLIWVMLGVYMKDYFGISESSYSWLPTTNALMVVFLQMLVTRQTRKYAATQVLPAGALIFALSMLIVAFSRGFWGFWAAMVVMTVGELITAPTSTTLVANLAPPNQRGRYLGLFRLSFEAGLAVGPLGAGLLNDAVGRQAPWLAAAVIGGLAVLVFVGLDRSRRAQEAQQV